VVNRRLRDDARGTFRFERREREIDRHIDDTFHHEDCFCDFGLAYKWQVRRRERPPLCDLSSEALEIAAHDALFIGASFVAPSIGAIGVCG